MVSATKLIRTALIVLGAALLASTAAHAQSFLDLNSLKLPDIKIEPVKGATLSPSLQVSFFMISLSLIPYIVICTTSWIRFSISLSYLKAALGTQQALSSQVLMGITMFVTLFMMYPVGQRINETAIQPYLTGKIEQAEFAPKLIAPLREFMLKQTRDDDLALFYNLSYNLRKKHDRQLGITTPTRVSAPKYADMPFQVIMPSFIMSEIKTGFFIGFMIYIPFLVVDMVVASVLMSMGMFMISPTTISVPFKLLMFTTMDGWRIVIMGVVRSFNRPDWMGPVP